MPAKLPSEATTHSRGWPHYDADGNCLCMNRCCFNDAGCMCRGCRQKSHIHFLREKRIRNWCARNKVDIPGDYSINLPREFVTVIEDRMKHGVRD